MAFRAFLREFFLPFLSLPGCGFFHPVVFRRQFVVLNGIRKPQTMDGTGMVEDQRLILAGSST